MRGWHPMRRWVASLTRFPSPSADMSTTKTPGVEYETSFLYVFGNRTAPGVEDRIVFTSHCKDYKTPTERESCEDCKNMSSLLWVRSQRDI